MPEPLSIALLASGLVGLALLVAAIRSLARAKVASGTTKLVAALVLLLVATVSGAVLVGTHGYRALTREDVAAVVRTEPVGPHTFRARFEFPDGTESSFTLSGDELYVDARIVKWTPFANLLGLHTAYELDRVAGRYVELQDEQEEARTVFSLAPRRPVDMFLLRKRFPQLEPLLDARYGSATFATATDPASYELRVSTTGLLLRSLPEN